MRNSPVVHGPAARKYPNQEGTTMGFLPLSSEQVIATVIRQFDQRYGVSVRAGLATTLALTGNALNSLERIADALEANTATARSLAAAQWVALAIESVENDVTTVQVREHLLAMGLPPEEVATIGFGPRRHPETGE